MSHSVEKSHTSNIEGNAEWDSYYSSYYVYQTVSLVQLDQRSHIWCEEPKP